MKKRIVSGIAAVVLTFSGAGTGITNIADLTLDVAAHAEETISEDTSSEDTSSEDTSSGEDPEEPLLNGGTCGENLTWVINEEGTLTISGEGEMYDYTDEGDAPWNADEVKNVVIGDGVTSIGECAFLYCDKIESVTIPDSVTKIGYEAFLMCTSLESVTIPESVTSIDQWAFGYDYDYAQAEYIKLENFRISCYIGSAGEQYAADNGFDYELIGIAPNIPVPAVTPGIGCVTLRWKAIENAEKYAVAVEVDGKWTLVEKTTDTSYVLKGLKEDTQYKVAIVAMFDGKWNKDFSGAKTVSPVATSGTCGEDLTWKLDKDGTLTISGTGDMDSYPADGTAPWSVAEVKNVVINDGVTSIGGRSFRYCINLESVTIPDSVTSIGDAAFLSCDKLESVTVPDGVTSIGYGTFAYCPLLKSVTIPDSVTSIGEVAFSDCSSLTSINIPNSVTSIGEAAFMNCSSLESITVPDGVESINEAVFMKCSGLKTVNLPDSITSIGYAAFMDCSSLESLIIPDSVKTIDKAAFLGCVGLESIDFGNGITSIDEYAFAGCAGLKSLTIPGSVTTIGRSVFRECAGLESVTLEYGVTVIGEYAFDECESLTSVVIPDSVTSIDYAAFSNCSSLESIVIPDSVTSLGDFVFNFCVNLESVTVPDSVTSIGEWAFNQCEKLKSINIPDGVTEIGKGAFYNCFALESIALPDSVTRIDEAAFNYCTSLESVDLGNGVTDIGINVFYGCGSVKSVIIPDSVTTIGSGAFYRCNGITSVTIPKTVTSIGEFALGYYDDGNPEPGHEIKVENYKIYCYKGTAGEQYATDNGFDYELLDETPANPVPTATPGDGCVTLEWEAVENAEKYAVAVEVNGKWTLIEKTTDTSYVLKGLKAGTEYNVAIIAMFDGKWNKDFSGAIVVTPNEAVSGYPTITNIEHSEKYHQFRLTWNAVEGAEEYGIAVKIDGKWKVQARTDKTKFTSPKLKEGSTVEMVICAKVNGKWDTGDLDSRAFVVTVE